MTEFLLELYVAKTNCAAAVEGATRLGSAAAQVTAEGTAVRVVRSIFVPQDETCYVLVEAATADAVRETAARAALPVERVVEATHDIESL
jgi:Nickel responsive protein SCO4226-like